MAEVVERAAAHKRVRRHSYRIYGALTAAVVAFVAWGFVRLTVCWGDYGWLGAVLCRSHWLMPLALILGVVALALLISELSELMRLEDPQRTLDRKRAAWHGYRRLERREFVHVTVAGILLLLSCLAYLYLTVLSRVRF